MEVNKILCGDSLQILKTLPDNSIDCVVTSPPYWALRDYGVEGQLGLEPKFREYITKLCNVFDEVKRILKKEGTCWVNMGDCYAGNMGKKNGWTDNKLGFEKEEAISKGVCLTKNIKIVHELTQKCLVQIPSRFAIEMTDRGWILRNEIIWHKPNCMPSSVKDRFTVDFEKIYFFTKSKKYCFEQQFEKYSNPINSWGRNKFNYRVREVKIGRIKSDQYKASLEELEKYAKNQKSFLRDRLMRPENKGRNMRSVWKIPSHPFKGSHFATFPEKLIETPIKAGCPERGVVLDPFMGAGTTALVALKLNRQFLGIELNPEYIKISQERIKPFLEQRKLK